MKRKGSKRWKRRDRWKGRTQRSDEKVNKGHKGKEEVAEEDQEDQEEYLCGDKVPLDPIKTWSSLT